MREYELSNGKKIPALGFGTFKIPEGSVVIDAVNDALQAGYRHIDTAAIYGNERGVGEGMRKSGIPREDIFLTSKVWNSDQGYDTTLEAFEKSLERLGTDYLDLYLIHWPKPVSGETWKALEKLYEEGRVRSIGVSNFTIRQLEELLKGVDIVPMVNQVELHPQFPQYELQEYCHTHGIIIESWATLMQGAIFELPLIAELAETYGCTVSQFATIWQLQMGNVPLVKSNRKKRIIENFELPDITISEEDLMRMKAVEGDRIGSDPENFDF